MNSSFVESIRKFAAHGVVTGLIMLSTAWAGQTPINLADIPQFVSPLVIPPVYVPDSSFSDHDSFTISVSQFQQDLGLGAYDSARQAYTGLLDSTTHLPVKTTVWGYGGWIRDPATGNKVHFSNYPGPTLKPCAAGKSRCAIPTISSIPQPGLRFPILWPSIRPSTGRTPTACR